MNNIKIHDNFLSTEECDKALNWLKTERLDTYVYNNKVQVVRDTRETKQFCLTISDRILSIRSDWRDGLYMRRGDLCRWDKGVGAGVHEDTHQNYTDLIYSSVIYLNENYEGGEIHFPQQKIIHKPKAGQLITFPSPYWHGVKLVENGIRYTLAMWHTDSKQKSKDWWETPYKVI